MRGKKKKPISCDYRVLIAIVMEMILFVLGFTAGFPPSSFLTHFHILKAAEIHFRCWQVY